MPGKRGRTRSRPRLGILGTLASFRIRRSRGFRLILRVPIHSSAISSSVLSGRDLFSRSCFPGLKFGAVMFDAFSIGRHADNFGQGPVCIASSRRRIYLAQVLPLTELRVPFNCVSKGNVLKIVQKRGCGKHRAYQPRISIRGYLCDWRKHAESSRR